MKHDKNVVKIASLDTKGYINDHVEVALNSDSILASLFREKDNGERYEVVVRRCFNPKRGQRDWQSIEVPFTDLSLEEALKLARPIANKEKVVLYQGTSLTKGKIIWNPKGWGGIKG